jgi:Ni,Fe-hydrogenase maturation factor
MKIVINKCHGGFGLSEKAEEVYRTKKGITDDESWWSRMVPRDDLILVDIVETMGEKSFGSFAELKVVEIPNDVEWQIDEYDGAEWVAEVHRTWS